MNNIYILVNGQELKATIMDAEIKSNSLYKVMTELGYTWVTAEQLIFK